MASPFIATVLPAQAGMILRPYGIRLKAESAPRASGDDPYNYVSEDGKLQCSPRKRG